MMSASLVTPLPIPHQNGSVPLAIRIALPPVLLIVALWAFSPQPVGLVAMACSLLMVLLAWSTYCVWQEGDQRRFPLFSVICVMYVIAYVLPLYLGEHLGQTSFGPRVLSPDAIDNTMLLALLGVSALAAGMAVPLPDRYATEWMLNFTEKPLAWTYVYFVCAATSLLTALLGINALGGGGRQALVDLEGVVSMVAFLLLFRRYLRGQSEHLEQALIVGFVILRLGAGVASGWLGSAIWFVLVLGVAHFDVRRRTPKAVIAGLVIVILFLQPGKPEFRKRYWHGIGNTVGTASERTTFWLTASLRAWSEALERPEKRGKLFDATVTRASLLEPTAMVVQMTPTQVPYQNGRLYKYLAVTLIPRAIWPDKPSFSESNQFYQVAYHITDRRDLGKVSMSVGTLAESYINFGWFGPPFVMFLLGLLLNLIRRYFLDSQQGEFLRSLGIALLPTLMIVESQAAQYLSGIIQAVALTILIFSPVLRFGRPVAGRGSVVQASGELV